MSAACEGVGRRPNDGDMIQAPTATMRSGGFNNGYAFCPACERVVYVARNGAVMRHRPDDPKRHTRDSWARKDDCPACGSSDLFSGWFDADDLAVDGQTPARGTRWTTFCNACGAEKR